MRYVWCLLLLLCVGCACRGTFVSTSNNKTWYKTAGEHPSHSVWKTHPMEEDESLPIYTMQSHDNIGFSFYTTRAIKQDKDGEYLHWSRYDQEWKYLWGGHRLLLDGEVVFEGDQVEYLRKDD